MKAYIEPPSKDDLKFDEYMKSLHNDLRTVQLPEDPAETVEDLAAKFTQLLNALRANGVGR